MDIYGRAINLENINIVNQQINNDNQNIELNSNNSFNTINEV
jgi:hypothetical protein